MCAVRKRKANAPREERRKKREADVSAAENKTSADFVKNLTEGGGVMEIQDLSMEQAKELCESEKGQETWKVVGDLVGHPIEFAYQDDYIARLLLCGTMGAIFVRKDKNIGLEGIALLENRAVTVYDKVVCTLAKGLYYEVFEEEGKASECYKKAIKKYAASYSAYLRLASIVYRFSGYDAAETFCKQGLAQLEKDRLCDRNTVKEIEMEFRGLLDQILKKKEDKEVYRGKPLEEILESEDETDLIIALHEYVGKKCRYGEAMERLSAPERVFYITQWLEMEVNNGGFSQYFFNSSGDFANEVADAFAEIGAVKTAEICKKAVSIYDGEVPADRDEREDVFAEDEEKCAVLDECDEAFFAYEEDLSGLSYAYVMKNKALFT